MSGGEELATYSDFEAKWAKRTKRTDPDVGVSVANNTWLRKDGDNYVIRLHETDIITCYPEGTYRLTTGGWFTVTSKQRLNRFTPFSVWSENHVWYIDHNGEKIPFEDGMVVGEAGGHLVTSTGEGIGKHKGVARRLRKFLKEYVESLTKEDIAAYLNSPCMSWVYPGEHSIAHDRPGLLKVIFVGDKKPPVLWALNGGKVYGVFQARNINLYWETVRDDIRRNLGRYAPTWITAVVNEKLEIPRRKAHPKPRRLPAPLLLEDFATDML